MTEVIEKTEYKKGYKKTKLGWIPEDWEVKKLKNLVKINRNTLTENTKPEYQFYYLDISAVKQGKILIPHNTIIFSEAPCRARRIVKQNNILFSTVRPYLQSFAVMKNSKENFVASTGFAILSDFKNINNMYLYQSLYSNLLMNQYKKSLVGTNYPALNNTDMLNLKFICPNDIKEQEKIAEILSAWDDGIETLEKLIEVKKHYLKNIAKKLLSNKTKSSEWSEFSLGSISINLNKKVCEKKLPVLSITAGTGFVLQSDKFGKNIAGNQYKNYTLLRKNEFSYNKGNSKKYAQGCVYCLKNYEEAAVPNVFISFKLNNEIALNEYFEQLFKYNYHGSKLKKYINSGVRDDGLLNLNSNNFFKIKFKIPQIEEQQKIVDVLNSYDREIELLNLKLEKLKEQKKGLMQKLLTGQIRVKV